MLTGGYATYVPRLLYEQRVVKMIYEWRFSLLALQPACDTLATGAGPLPPALSDNTVFSSITNCNIPISEPILEFETHCLIMSSEEPKCSMFI